MKIAQSLAVAGVCAAAAVQAREEATVFKPLIVGGTEVPVGQKTWMTGIRDTADGMSRCGASLITPTHVLTAAHCTSRPYVSIGTHFKTNNTDGEQIKVVGEIKHPKYNLPDDNAASWDYKILTLERPSSYKPVKLLKEDPETYAGALATVIGWGNTIEEQNGAHDTASNNLLRVDVAIRTTEDCKKLGMSPLDESMVCAGGVEGEDTCNGDSGGPIFLETEQGDAQFGIVSWGNGCARKDQPGVYSRIFTVMDWVQEHAPNVEFISLSN